MNILVKPITDFGFSISVREEQFGKHINLLQRKMPEKKIGQLRIAFIAGTLSQGGAEKQLFHIIEGLLALGCKPDVFTFDESGYWVQPIRGLGVNVIHIPAVDRFERIKYLYSYINREKYDFVHSQHFYTNLYAVVACLFSRTVSIGSLRSDAISEVKGMGIFGLLSLTLPSILVANSHNAIKNASTFFIRNKRLFYLHNFVDLTKYKPPDNKDRLNKKPFKVIIIGTIWKPKRIDRVIEIALIINQKKLDPGVIFEIVGDGEQLNEMKALSEKYGLLNKSVFFKGRRNDIPKLLREAEILLLTSENEGTPNVILEAMANGLPIVATSVGEVPFLVNKSACGHVFSQDDLEGMADSIISLINSPEKCKSFGENGRLFIQKEFSDNSFRKRLLTLYGIDHISMKEII